MNKRFSKVLNILLVIFFPVGIIYCIGKNLFGGNFSTFLGGLLLFASGFVLALFLLRPDIVKPVLSFFNNLKI